MPALSRFLAMLPAAALLGVVAVGEPWAAAPTAAVDDARWSALYDEALDALNRGDYAAAERAAQAALAEAERVLGLADPDTAATLTVLGAAVDRQGRHAAAEPLQRRALAIFEKVSGPAHPDTAVALNNLALTLEKLGRYGDAEALLARALKIAEGALGPQHADTARMRGALARVLEAQGRYGATAALAGAGADAAALRAKAQELLRGGDAAGAAAVQREVVAVLEKSRGPEHPDTATALSNLAYALNLQGRTGEAEPHYRRALAIREKALGGEHPDTAVALNNLGNVLHGQGKAPAAGRGAGALPSRTYYSEAQQLFERALAVNEKVLGPEHPATATSLNNLAVVQESLGRYEEAEALHRRALAIRQARLGPAHPDTALSMTNLSLVLDRQGRVAEAEVLHRAAVDVARKAGNPRALVVHASRLGYTLAGRGRLREALPFYLEALDTLDALYAQTRGLAEETRQGFLAQFRDVYAAAIALLAKLHREHPDAGYDRQALAAASRNQSRLFSELLRQADVARYSAAPGFAGLKAELDRRLNALAELRLARASLPPSEAGAAGRRAELDAALAAEQAALAQVEERLRREFPRFMELTRPRPVTVEDLQQRLLRPGESLLAYAALEQETLVFAVTRERFRMVSAPLSRRALAQQVHAVRRPLEQAAAGEPLLLLRLVDPAVLHGLYRELVAPVADLLGGRVLVVTDGALATLPLEMLVSRYGAAERAEFEAARAAAGAPFFAEYAGLDWLGRRQRFAYLPSLSALVSQRLYPRPGGDWTRQLVAFADPVFPDEAAGAAARLPRLADTGQEAREIAAAVGGEQALLLRAAAQEKAAKSGVLRGGRYLLFATHGLLAGEFVGDGAGERPVPGQPALALTLSGNLEGEDGYLTLGEVIEFLQLDAELVALSACNTAGGSEAARNGEGFAGLTRAFMYAGARRLVVSHWSVESAAARGIMTETFRALRSGAAPEAALAAARAAVMDTRLETGGEVFSRAHPFFWAPFVLVGD